MKKEFASSIDSYCKCMCVIAVGLHRMLGGNFGHDTKNTLVSFVGGDAFFGSPAELTWAIETYYDKVCSTYDNRPTDFENADGYVLGSTSNERPKSPALIAFIAWCQGCAKVNKLSSHPTIETLKALAAKIRLEAPTLLPRSSAVPSAKVASTPGRTQRDDAAPAAAAASTTPSNDAAKEAAKKAYNAFTKKHQITDSAVRMTLWNALSNKRLTFKTGAPWDETKVRAVCSELNIQLVD